MKISCFYIGRKCMDKVFNDVCNCVKIRDLAFQKVGRKYVTFFCRRYCGFAKNDYLCIPIIEDHSAQPADTQLVREI